MTLWNLAASAAIFERFKGRLPVGLVHKDDISDEIKVTTQEEEDEDNDVHECEEEEEGEEGEEDDEDEDDEDMENDE